MSRELIWFFLTLLTCEFEISLDVVGALYGIDLRMVGFAYWFFKACVLFAVFAF